MNSPVDIDSCGSEVAGSSRKALLLVAIVLGLIVCFCLPLWRLIQYAWRSELYSYIVLVPFITTYLLWTDRYRLSSIPVTARSRSLSLVAFVLGIALLAGYFLAVLAGWKPSPEEFLALMISSFLACVAAAFYFCLGAQYVHHAFLPLSLLLFMVPLPEAVLQSIVGFLQHRSADVAAGLFSLSSTPYLRQETFFQLPGIPLQVAPECSGIHSTVVLFITSLVAGYLFLRSNWRRAFLCLSVLPLALLRNGLRIFIIGQLCVNIGPEMIDSPIHKRGGPLFFMLSLIPFFLLVWGLRSTERKKGTVASNFPLVPQPSSRA